MKNKHTSRTNAGIGSSTVRLNQKQGRINRPITDASAKLDISNDNLVKCLMASAVSGWQLYAMSRSMFDAIQTYSEDEKKTFFAKIAKKRISDENGNMVLFKPSDTIEILNTVALPFWLAKVDAEKKVEAYEKMHGSKL